MKRKDQEIADKYAACDCTLNGRPARIVGRMLDYALVRSEHGQCEFSWFAVARIMQNDGGRFMDCLSK